VQASRLLTLIGIGGTGKARLALQRAERALPIHDHGVWWVDLSPLTILRGRLEQAIKQSEGRAIQGELTGMLDEVATRLTFKPAITTSSTPPSCRPRPR